MLLTFGAAGCDDFISTEPKGQITSETFFQTAEHAIQATNATYSMLRAWEVHVFAWLGMTDMASDDATKGSTPTDAGALLTPLEDLTWDAGNGAFSATWTGYYNGIYRANVAIQGIPRTNASDQLKARLIGENKFLRAYYYFFLVRAYGGVPLITEPLTPANLMQQRATREAVYAQIEADLTDAIAALPESYPASDLGRATKGAAQSLLAEVHLFQSEYDPAFTNAQAVIASNRYSLFGDYETLFRETGENSSESVFEVQAVAVEGGNNARSGGGQQYSQVQGVRGIPNIGWGFNTPSDELEDSYEPGDPRLQATILYPWEMLPDGSERVVHLNTSMPNNRYNQKVFTPPETPGGTGASGTNIRRIRYSHVLLTGAEAAARTNREAQARDWLNDVRERARDGRVNTLGLTVERLAPSIAEGRLNLPAGTSRVFVRYVDPSDPAFAAGFRSFTSSCVANNCGGSNPVQPPVLVENIDIITAVDGAPVTTPEQYFAEVDKKTPGTPVAVTVLRISQTGTPSSQTLAFVVNAQRLLPDVTASGAALLQAIWEERRHELAMEQHRWFDIIRQGRAKELMAIHGKDFIEGKHELYPIPAGEVAIAGLQQNPGY